MATDRGRETVAVVKVVAMEEEGEAEVRVAVGRVASTEARAAVGRVAAREAAVRAVVTVVEAMVVARGGSEGGGGDGGGDDGRGEGGGGDG